MGNKNHQNIEYYYQSLPENFKYNDFSNLKVIKNERHNELHFLIDNPTCKIPHWDPTDQSLDEVLIQSDPFECPKYPTDGLIYESQGVLHINGTIKESILVEYGEDPEASFNCCVFYILRDLEDDDSNFRLTDECMEFFNDTFSLTEPMTKIDCYLNENLAYEKYIYLPLPAKLHSMDRSPKNLSSRKQFENEDKLSVLILGMDSVSRLMFHRSLPQTKQVLDGMGAVEFRGYNRVADNTFPCLIPLLTGRSQNDILSGCVHEHPNGNFDWCHYLWDDFEENGYVTAYVENYNQITTFNCGKNGFQKIPTNFYSKSFFEATSEFLSGTEHCFEEVPEDEFVYLWALEYHRRLQTVPKFGFFWINRFSHDNPSHIQHIDPFLSRLLTVMTEEYLLNHTVLIVMSDHGTRFGDVTKLKVGQYQANLPLLYFVFPSWYQTRYQKEMETLRFNAHNRLVTLYDVRETILQDILRPSATNFSQSTSLGLNLFHTVSVNRTCDHAGILTEYCSCHRYEHVVDLSDTSVIRPLTSQVVDFINSLTVHNRDLCLELYLEELIEVKILSANDNWPIPFKHDTDFVVTLRTTPGSAIFEVTATFRLQTQTFEMSTQIKRLNAYGTSSECVADYEKLRLVCFCKDSPV